MSPQSSFIFPIYNEAKLLNIQIEKFISTIPRKCGRSFEIILVENGSTDNTWKKIKKLKEAYPFIKSHRLPHPSYGLAIRWGILNATGRKIYVLNADYFDTAFIEKAHVLLNTVDLVIGSKTLANSQDRRPIYRRLSTYFFNVFLRLVLNYPGTDTHGIKAFRKSKALLHFAKICRTQNELFDTELILRLTRNGAVFVDLPQRVEELRPSRYLGMRRIKSTLSDLISIVKTKYFLQKNFYPSLIDADDFGLSTKVNKAIFDAVDAQTINIVSIMPNLATKKQLQQLQRKSKNIAYSMHFNLLRGKSVAKKSQTGSLVHDDGTFYNLPQFMFRLLLGLIKLEEIKVEFFAQYYRLLKMGITPIYLNSEQHVHIFSPINQLLAKEIRLTSIKKIRSLASSFHSLENAFFRKIGLITLKNICLLRYGLFDEFSNKYDAHIVHPGAKRSII